MLNRFFCVSYLLKGNATQICSMNNKPDTKWLRSGAAKMNPSQIDAAAGIIRDVVMVEEGPAKGHGVHLDADFIAAITKYDKKYFAKAGLKARFGHPSASGETMGTQLGTFSNFRQREVNGRQQEIADLQLLDAAENSPTHPGMRTWVLDMAEEQPDFIMSSIVFTPSSYFQNINGKKRKVWEYDEDDNWQSPISGEPVYVEFDEKQGAAHYYTDLVEQGAATDKLFSSQVNTHLFAARVDGFLADNPDIITFLKNNPDAVAKWLQRAGYTVNSQPTKKMAFDMKKWLMGEDASTPPTEELSSLRTALQAAQQDIAALKAQQVQVLTPLNVPDVPETNELEELKQQIAQLQATMATFAKGAADTPTGGDTLPAPAATAAKRAYQTNPINRHLYGN
jgi:hypothetical protein